MDKETYERVIRLHYEKLHVGELRARFGIDSLSDEGVDNMSLLQLIDYIRAFNATQKERIGAVMRECLKETLHDGRLNEIDQEIAQL